LFRVKPVSTVCLWRQAFDNVKWTGSLIWTEISVEMLTECNAAASEAEGIVTFLAGTEGSLAAAILHQNDGGWRVSLRSLSEDVDVAAIAATFGGGGHPRAAGCQVRGGEAEKAAFLEQVSKLAEREKAAQLSAE
jgi:bifunctional oligoribonuclease and PAP phosphatase NrnA